MAPAISMSVRLDPANVHGHSAAGQQKPGGGRPLSLRKLRNNSFVTMLSTWLGARLVGEDQFGNLYYCKPRGGDWRHERRWVVFAHQIEPTEVPPGWYGWLHKRLQHPPSETSLPAQKWEKERVPNLTGTPGAFMPSGALQKGGQRPPATGDYEAWRPE
jgi:NADH:ubiquinone oxidoreductase subunit